VNSRYSYRYDEFVWGGKFMPAFEIGTDGQMVLNVDQVGNYAMPEQFPPAQKGLPTGTTS
jgi:hypothetical protein